MKKSNVIIFALLAACSAFLLWLWYLLGFNRVDNPLDLVLSVVWWAVIVIAIVAVVKTEQVRRRRVRTVYVGEVSTFNSEQGLQALAAGRPAQDAIASILENLKYDFKREDFPDKEKFQPKYFVRTKEFKVEQQVEASSEAPAAEAASGQVVSATDQASEQKTWKGEVVVVETKEEKPFDTPEELASILAALDPAA